MPEKTKSMSEKNKKNSHCTRKSNRRRNENKNANDAIEPIYVLDPGVLLNEHDNIPAILQTAFPIQSHRAQIDLDTTALNIKCINQPSPYIITAFTPSIVPPLFPIQPTNASLCLLNSTNENQKSSIFSSRVNHQLGHETLEPTEQEQNENFYNVVQRKGSNVKTLNHLNKKRKRSKCRNGFNSIPRSLFCWKTLLVDNEVQYETPTSSCKSITDLGRKNQFKKQKLQKIMDLSQSSSSSIHNHTHDEMTESDRSSEVYGRISKPRRNTLRRNIKKKNHYWRHTTPNIPLSRRHFSETLPLSTVNSEESIGKSTTIRRNNSEGRKGKALIKEYGDSRMPSGQGSHKRSVNTSIRNKAIDTERMPPKYASLNEIDNKDGKRTSDLDKNLDLLTTDDFINDLYRKINYIRSCLCSNTKHSGNRKMGKIPKSRHSLVKRKNISLSSPTFLGSEPMIEGDKCNNNGGGFDDINFNSGYCEEKLSCCCRETSFALQIKCESSLLAAPFIHKSHAMVERGQSSPSLTRNVDTVTDFLNSHAELSLGCCQCGEGSTVTEIGEPIPSKNGYNTHCGTNTNQTMKAEKETTENCISMPVLPRENDKNTLINPHCVKSEISSYGDGLIPDNLLSETETSYFSPKSKKSHRVKYNSKCVPQKRLRSPNESVLSIIRPNEKECVGCPEQNIKRQPTLPLSHKHETRYNCLVPIEEGFQACPLPQNATASYIVHQHSRCSIDNGNTCNINHSDDCKYPHNYTNTRKSHIRLCHGQKDNETCHSQPNNEHCCPTCSNKPLCCINNKNPCPPNDSACCSLRRENSNYSPRQTQPCCCSEIEETFHSLPCKKPCVMSNPTENRTDDYVPISNMTTLLECSGMTCYCPSSSSRPCFCQTAISNCYSHDLSQIMSEIEENVVSKLKNENLVKVYEHSRSSLNDLIAKNIDITGYSGEDTVLSSHTPFNNGMRNMRDTTTERLYTTPHRFKKRRRSSYEAIEETPYHIPHEALRSQSREEIHIEHSHHTPRKSIENRKTLYETIEETPYHIPHEALRSQGREEIHIGHSRHTPRKSIESRETFHETIAKSPYRTPQGALSTRRNTEQMERESSYYTPRKTMLNRRRLYESPYRTPHEALRSESREQMYIEHSHHTPHKSIESRENFYETISESPYRTPQRAVPTQRNIERVSSYYTPRETILLRRSPHETPVVTDRRNKEYISSKSSFHTPHEPDTNRRMHEITAHNLYREPSEGLVNAGDIRTDVVHDTLNESVGTPKITHKTHTQSRYHTPTETVLRSIEKIETENSYHTPHETVASRRNPYQSTTQNRFINPIRAQKQMDVIANESTFPTQGISVMNQRGTYDTTTARPYDVIPEPVTVREDREAIEGLHRSQHVKEATRSIVHETVSDNANEIITTRREKEEIEKESTYLTPNESIRSNVDMFESTGKYPQSPLNNISTRLVEESLLEKTSDRENPKLRLTFIKNRKNTIPKESFRNRMLEGNREELGAFVVIPESKSVFETATLDSKKGKFIVDNSLSSSKKVIHPIIKACPSEMLVKNVVKDKKCNKNYKIKKITLSKPKKHVYVLMKKRNKKTDFSIVSSNAFNVDSGFNNRTFSSKESKNRKKYIVPKKDG